MGAVDFSTTYGKAVQSHHSTPLIAWWLVTVWVLTNASLSEGKDLLVVSGVPESCHDGVFNGVYERTGTTADTRAYYNRGDVFYIYFDQACKLSPSPIVSFQPACA
jgi:hypothetical protein